MMAAEPSNNVAFVEAGYSVVVVGGGGIVVCSNIQADDELNPSDTRAFTDAHDFLDWVRRAHTEVQECSGPSLPEDPHVSKPFPSKGEPEAR